ncbi:thioredoxin family protein [Bacillus massiliigorillae]|uniref:thioredoxin family protein n=1 Tax=Bacillus massiliigorillae TaxID=1243664 RepID=UPI0003A11EE9|nr:thioredoxin family protein [Bacillus massiliigorillae]
MNEWNGEEITNKIRAGNSFCLYLYTPICGTCQVASKMLAVVKEIVPTVELGKSDVNYIRGLAEQYQVESVPCLLLFREGKLHEKIYAFHSVPYLLELFRDMEQ